MTRFETLSELGPHAYSAVELAEMSDEELISEINSLESWDSDLLADLIWRAFPDYEEEWECGDEICYQAAQKLGFEI